MQFEEEVMDSFIQQGCIKLFKSDSKGMVHVTLKTGVMAAENSALPSQK